MSDRDAILKLTEAVARIEANTAHLPALTERVSKLESRQLWIAAWSAGAGCVVSVVGVGLWWVLRSIPRDVWVAAGRHLG